jgi:integrase
VLWKGCTPSGSRRPEKIDAKSLGYLFLRGGNASVDLTARKTVGAEPGFELSKQALPVLRCETGMRNERELYHTQIENIDWMNELIFVPGSKTSQGRRKAPVAMLWHILRLTTICAAIRTRYPVDFMARPERFELPAF